jgi:GNAT superfamily N-acetyltransferase
MIREFRADDAAAIRGCIVELQDFERQIDDRLRPGEAMASEYLRHILGRCREHAGTILVAEHGGAIVGFAAILARVPFESLDDPPGEYALVSDLAVLEVFRGRGIGTGLLSEAEQYATAAGATELRISVLSANETAVQLYRRAGFIPYSETLAKRIGSKVPMGAERLR